MIPFISKEEMQSSLDYPHLIDALEKAFTEDVTAPVRHVHSLSSQTDTSLLLMPAWQTERNTGVKLVTVAPHNQHHPTVHAIYMLLDTRHGVPLTLMDGEELTIRRTAAASALASGFLSREESAHLVIVGNGKLAPHLAVAHCHRRPIKKITLWGRNTEKSERCQEHILSHPELPANVQVEITNDLATQCQVADIISCATTSQQAIVQSSWVKPGTHIDLVGGFTPTMREVDDAVMSRATVFVDTFAGAVAEAGDIVQCLHNGSLSRDAIVAELATLCRGQHRGRQTASEVTVFKSVGTALEDLCAANLVWESWSNKSISPMQ